MDNSDPDITFDEKGVCNYCVDAARLLPHFRFSRQQEEQNLQALKQRIKTSQKGEYDSILGLSGGVDSSYVAYLAMQMGLNPLCVHFDNGWNSDIAVKNIRRIIDKTGFDLYTYVIDWPEFRDLQRAFIKAGVIDIEMLTDQAIFASLFRLRREKNIASVLGGTNYATEHGLPHAWIWSKMDRRNIAAIQKRFGDMRLKSFPTMNNMTWLLIRQFGLGGVFEEPLNQVNYSKTKAMEVLKEVFGWQYYGGKHYESVFTKFYQAHILPTKFGVDKRKSHLSCLVRNGEISREQAVEELSEPLYDANELRRDKSFVLKKLGFSDEEFDEIMRKPPVPHDHYPSDQSYMRLIRRVGKMFIKKKGVH